MDLSAVRAFEGSFLGFNLSVIPTEAWGIYILMPIIAGVSAWLMCWTQNLSNVLQHEQGKLSQYGMTILSVGIYSLLSSVLFTDQKDSMAWHKASHIVDFF